LLAEPIDRAEAARCEALLTFDRQFIKAAASNPVGVAEPE